MLFKFASYLLGTNNEESKTDQQQQLNIESNTQQDTLIETKENSNNLINKDKENENSTIELNSNKTEDLIDDYMYDEQLINCSKLNGSNLQTDLVKDDQLCDQLEDDCEEDDQWIYITPIKCKNEKQLNEEDEFASEQEENCSLIDKKISSKENDVPKQDEIAEKEQFNFYDYFNNKNSSLVTVDEEHCSPVKSSKLDSSTTKPIYKKVNDYKLQQQQLNRMEQSWIIHPPACFQFENTFLLEEDPLTNHYIENPQLSVMASIDKENSSLTNSSTLNSAKNLSTRILADRNSNNNANNQTKEKTSIASRKSMRKRVNSTRKSNKKQQNKKPTKKNDSLAQSNDVLPVEQVANVVENTTEISEEKQVLCERIEKQLLAHYLTVNPNQINSTTTSNSIATSSSSNGSTHHQSTNHPHNHFAHLHFISNSNNVANANSTNSNIENKKGSKSLRRNNKVALKRDNLANKPFTLHRKLC